MAVKWIKYAVDCADPVKHVKQLPEGFYRNLSLWHKMNERPPYPVFTGRVGLSLPVVLMTLVNDEPILEEADMLADGSVVCHGREFEDIKDSVVGWTFHKSNY